MSRLRVEEIVRLTNTLNVDAVAIAGDLFDGNIDHLRTKAEPLADLVLVDTHAIITLVMLQLETWHFLCHWQPRCRCREHQAHKLSVRLVVLWTARRYLRSSAQIARHAAS